MRWGFDTKTKRLVVHIDGSDTFEQRLIIWQNLFEDPRGSATK
jgi:hypothetical protein